MYSINGGLFMNFLQLAKEQRYSVRKFKTDKIEKEKLGLILVAGRIAPTAANLQPQLVLVLDSEDSLTKIKICTPYHFNAPLVLLIYYDREVCWKHQQSGKSSGDVDAYRILYFEGISQERSPKKEEEV